MIAVAATNPHLAEESRYTTLDHFVRPQFRPVESQQQQEQPMTIPKLESTPEELIACFGPDFYVAGGVR